MMNSFAFIFIPTLVCVSIGMTLWIGHEFEAFVDTWLALYGDIMMYADSYRGVIEDSVAEVLDMRALDR